MADRFPAPAPLRALAVLVSAVGYAAAFPPWSSPWLAFVALVPFLWALQRSTALGAAIAGFVWGTLCISLFGYWVPIGLATYWQQPAWFGFLFALGVAVVFKGSYFAAFGWCYQRWQRQRRPLERIALGASLYVAFELARAKLLTGHPWLLLGYAAVPYTTWAQMADVGGVYLLSFCIFAVNAAVLEVATARHAPTRRRAPLLALAALVLLPLLYGAFRDRQAFGSGERSQVAIVQGNLDLGTQWREEFYGVGLERYLRMSYGLARSKPDLVVWPESAMTFFVAEAPSYLDALMTFSKRTRSDLVAGGPYFEPGHADGPYYNSAFLISASGISGRYDKVHLLPFAEYFPLRTIRFLRREFARVKSFVAASAPVLLPTAAGRAGTLICFEAIFPELVRREVRMGAELLLNLSNDAWLRSAAGAEQHLLMVRLRAIETRRWVVRSTTTGVSAVIDPHGRFRGRIEADTAGTLVSEIERSRASTPYLRLGDLFAWLCVSVSVAAAVGFSRRRS